MTLRRDVASKHVDVKDIERGIKAMGPVVRDRINTAAQLAPDGCDVLIPELYRQFQQER